MSPRVQCEKCPWKVSTNPHDIPGGYSEELHRGLRKTMSTGFRSLSEERPIMACHETPPGAEKPCVGWLHHQLGRGNNFGLRLRYMRGDFGEIEVVGEQHPTFEDTLP